MKVHEALTRVMEDVRAVGKTERNTHQNYNFRGIDAVVNAVAGPLREHGVLVLPRVLDVQAENVSVGRNNTQMRSVTLLVEYTFVGPEGDTLVCMSVGEAMDSGDKAVPKAMSVALRTCLLQALMLPTDEPDPDTHSYERNAPKFVADVRESWPESLSVGQAKQVFLFAYGGDKALAAQAWEQADMGEGPFPCEEMDAIVTIAKEFFTTGEGKPF
jgi:hypothetical protein